MSRWEKLFPSSAEHASSTSNLVNIRYLSPKSTLRSIPYTVFSSVTVFSLFFLSEIDIFPSSHDTPIFLNPSAHLKPFYFASLVPIYFTLKFILTFTLSSFFFLIPSPFFYTFYTNHQSFPIYDTHGI